MPTMTMQAPVKFRLRTSRLSYLGSRYQVCSISLMFSLRSFIYRPKCMQISDAYSTIFSPAIISPTN